MEASTSRPSHQAQAVLRGMIRGTGAFIAAAAALFLVVILPLIWMVFHSTAMPRPHLGWIGWLLGVLGAALYLIFFLVGYRMFRTVNVVTVSNFAFVYAYLLAKTWHHFLPPNLPEAWARHLGKSPFLAQGNEPGIHYRGLLAIAAFFVFYILIKDCLLRVLNLGKPSSPSTELDASIPEFPRKSPLIELES